MAMMMMMKKKVLCCFVIPAIVMSAMPISIFALETDYRREIVS